MAAAPNRDLLAMLLVLIIHDDRNLVAKHSSIEIVVNQGRFFLLRQGRSREAQWHEKS